MPLSQLKIDQSFVHNLSADPRAAAIVRTIVTLADSLGLDVIAEGWKPQSNATAWHASAATPAGLPLRPARGVGEELVFATD
ncbi:MAG: EAL domain-containing protein [Paenacidovorax caeni]